MKTKNIAIFFALFIFATNLSAQKGAVKGTVISMGKSEAMEFVNISVNRANDDKFQTGSITDETGAFILTDIPLGSYNLKISYMGYKPSITPFQIEKEDQTVNLGKIYLEENSELLDAVQVVGMQTQMQFDIDKKVFNVDQNIASAGGTASDILDKIPSVEVDNEGEISLRGSSDVTIWINGKASGLSEENRAQILEQLPAETIEKIEVITNPSAKYSPEGTSGIINIVLKKDRIKGYYGSVQAGVDTRGGYNASGNINLNIGKFESYASIGYRHRHHIGESENYRTNSDGTMLNSLAANENNGNNIFARAGVTFHATDKDQLYLNAFGMMGKRNSLDTTYYFGDAINYTRHRRSESTGQNLGGNAEIGYKHEFGKDHNLDISASYNVWGMDNENFYYDNYIFGINDSTAFQRQTSNVTPKHWNLQADYVNAFNDNFKLEAGYKGNLQREDSPVTTFVGPNEEEAVIAEQLYNRFIYNRDIHALYTTFSGRIDKFGFQVGLRGEHTKVYTESLAYGQVPEDVTPYETSDFNLFPSAFLTYQLPNNNEIQFNYSRRISRPWGGQLNSFVDIRDPLNISYGNPELRPSFSNALEFNYMKTWTNHLASVSAYYRSTDDVRQRIRFLADDNVMHSTWENVAFNRSAGTELVIKNSFANIVDLTTTVNMFYYHLDSFSYYIPEVQKYVTGEAESDFSWNARLIANINIPKVISIQITGRYRAKQVIAQGYREPSYSIDLGIRKSIGDFSFSLTGRDVLNSRKHHNITYGEGFTQESKGWRGGWQIGLTVTYGFGNMKAKPNKNQQGMSGDDSMQGSGYGESYMD